ncbi:osmotically inducible protein OsmC, partial [bacterium]
LGPNPLDALLASAAACSAMDTLSILRKKRQNVTGYRVEVEFTKPNEGEWPHPVESIAIRHIVSGPNLDEAAVARSLELTDEKYCTIISTLRSTPDVRLTYTIERTAENAAQ